MSAARLAAAGVLIAVVSGCGSAASPPAEADLRVPAPTPGSGEPIELWTDRTRFDWPGSSEVFAAHCPSDEAEHLDGGVDVGDVVVCTTEIRRVEGDGSWRYGIVRRVTGGIDELLRTYAEPDDDTEVDVCTANYVDPGLVWIKDADRVISTVRAPTDRCHPLEDASAAFNGLTTVLVAEERLDQTASQLSNDTSCPDDWLDVLARPLEAPPTDQPATPWPLDGGRLVACSYEVMTGSEHGRLIAGRTLRPAERAEVDRELAAATIDASCVREGQSRFVVLAASAGFVQHTYIALDGCAVQQNSASWRGSGALRALLD